MKKNLFKILFMLLISGIYYYFFLPAINITSPGFWTFIIFLLINYYIINLFSSVNFVKSLETGNFNLINKKSLIVIPLIIMVALVGITITNFILSPIFFSSSYAKRIEINEKDDFVKNVKEIDVNALPVIDKDSSIKLGDRVMGQMPELVSQFDVSENYTQINYKDKILRVTPLEYNDFFKYLSNRKEGIKGYITVDSLTGDSDLIKLEKGMKFVESAIFHEDLNRVLRFKYPTKVFGDFTFEIDDKGHPYWIIPVVKYHGVGIRKEIKEVIILNPVNGKSKLYNINEVPDWVDHVYSANLIIEQINDWGQYKSGFINSKIGQKNVVKTTEGYNYTVMNGDVYMYTGITSAVADESNIGFVMTNLRTKETNYYAVPGAEEYSAMASAEGKVQQMNYSSTFPILINLNNKPTYFVSLKDNAGLVKMYGFVDVVDYQKVVVSDASNGIEEAINNYLGDSKLINTTDITTEITIKNISTAIISGNSYYYIIDENNNKYKASIKVNEKIIPFIKINDTVNITYKKLQEVTEIKKIEK